MRFPSPKTFLHAVRRFLGRPEVVPASIAGARRAICEACPHYENSQCQLCTCFVPLKVLLSTESCPDKPQRWREYFSPKRDGLL